jgi:hypothetical protein
MGIRKHGRWILFVPAAMLILSSDSIGAVNAVSGKGRATVSPDPNNAVSFKLWYRHPAAKWTEALPVENGRLGAMVFGMTDEERIQFNEETYWSGGPYSQTVRGAHQALPRIQKLIFEGDYIKAHRLFGRQLMGYPVEQQKCQSLGNLIIKFAASGAVEDYNLELDLDTAIIREAIIKGTSAMSERSFRARSTKSSWCG